MQSPWAFGPARPGIGSWEWLGEDLAEELGSTYDIFTFTDEVPACDVAVVIKELLPPEPLQQAAQKAPILYCPVDCYGSAAEIDGDGLQLRSCDRIVLHCERLRKYFQSYARVTILDHHLRFIPDAYPQRTATDHPTILWVGHRSHLPLLVEYANRHRLLGRLEVLTNWDGDPEERNATEFGFDRRIPVRVRRWTGERHRAAAFEADLALDLKGRDFRQRHKPAAKALDFLASNLPLAINPDSSPADHLRRMGFEVAAPDDRDRWLSKDYRTATERFGQWLRQTFSRSQIAHKWRQLIDEVRSQKRQTEGLPQ